MRIHGITVSFLVLFLALVLSRCASGETVITFDDLGNTGTNGVLLTNQYDSFGADFGGTATVCTVGNYNSVLYPPYSGSNVALNTSQQIVVTAVGGTWSYAGGYVTTALPGPDVLSAYNASGTLLATDSFDGPNTPNQSGTPNTYLSVSAPDIAYVTFRDQGGYAYYETLDNFTFDPSADPDPATAPLPSAAYGGLALLGALGCGLLIHRTLLISDC